MERNEISIHEAKVYLALSGARDRWLSNSDIAEMVPDVAERTIRLHTKRLASLGLLDIAEVFPSHRFRYSEKADKRNRAYLDRLARSLEVFGLVTPGERV